MGKHRTDTFEAALTDEQRWALYEKTRRFPWYQASEWAAEEFEIAPPSRSTMYRFVGRMRSMESAHKIETALSVKENVRREMAAVGEMDDELQFAWEQLAMESAMRGDAEEGQRYLAMAMKLREAALEREKLKIKQQAEKRAGRSLTLMREKFEAAETRAALADRAEKVVAANLSPKERDRKLKDIFGL